MYMYVNIRLTLGMRNSLFDGRGIAELQYSRLLSVSENAYDSLTTWYIWIKFHTYFFKHCPSTGMQNRDGAAGRI